MKQSKKFPMDGPPVRIQALKLKSPRSNTEEEELQRWVRDYKSKSHRKETAAHYGGDVIKP